MKRLIAASLLAVLMLWAGGFLAPSHAQSPGTDLKPTFVSPTPGLYVNGWPAFTVSYPKEWVEMPVGPGTVVFRAGGARPDLPLGANLPALLIGISASLLPLEDWTKMFMPLYASISTGHKVLSDKPSRLKDGTSAREVEVEYVTKNGPKQNDLIVMTKKDLAWVSVVLTDDKKIGEDLRKIAYSLTFLQGRDEPVEVPPDVRAFLDMWCVDIMSRDVGTIMSHFSDRFFNRGVNKAMIEQFIRNDPASPIRREVISIGATVTVFESQGDKAYVDGFFLAKGKGDVTALKGPMTYRQIIKEHGEWKWYGNQR